MAAGRTITFELNGVPRRAAVCPGQSLLEVLRGAFTCTSLKDGCAPQGQCGCCLALVDGKPKDTCAVPAEKVDGKAVLTLEGVPEVEKKLYADAFQAAAGLQCGFCTPGLVLRTKWLADQGRPLTRPEIAKALDGHLCRCTGYVKIVDAVELILAARRGGPWPVPVEGGGVGARLQRYGGAELALGTRPFVADLDFPGLLHGVVVLSRHARARVVKVDVSKALAAPGVAAVATARDVPGDRWVGLIHADWPVFVAEGEEARTVGDVLAAVAAEDPHAAREAARLVEVEYEPLPPVLDPAEAIRPGAPRVNPRHDNVLSVTTITRGDGGGRPRGLRRHPAHAPADEGLRGGARHQRGPDIRRRSRPLALTRVALFHSELPVGAGGSGGRSPRLRARCAKRSEPGNHSDSPRRRWMSTQNSERRD
jgi:xanthine dehydrogenase molybdenum-binding subunit